ncbi:MAG: peptidase S41, partial [Waterburya sp.]
TPNGRDINKEGIHPDVVLKLNEQQLKELYSGDSSGLGTEKLGTAKDPQFTGAIDVLNEKVQAQKNAQPQAAK